VCEAHPWKPFPHDACAGPGDPCPECQTGAIPKPPDGWNSIASTARQTTYRTERVWTLVKAGHRYDCELRFHGESYGWECQLLEDGELRYGQRFPLHAGALAEAAAHHARLVREGWTVPATNHPVE
jgi:hypothetical protein